MKKEIIILFIISLFFLVGCEKEEISSELTKCIGSKSTLYVSTGCTTCLKQETMFGKNLKYLNIVNCAINPGKCNEVNIIKVPTWVINDNKYLGVQSAEELKVLTRCE